MRNARAALALTLGLSALAMPFVPRTGQTASRMPAATKRATSTAAAATIAFEKFKLANGLTVILHSDRSLPLVAVNVWYHVGPANEPAHRSGFAHLFEHLMFEGSKYVGHEFDRILESIGATNSNGTTSWDRTNYFETAPSENLETLLWLESDRMGFMIDTLTQERLDVQRDVVKNERRQSYENAPYGPSSLAMLNALFPEGHPYHGAVIGSMQDLSAATLADVTEFFRQYYAPSNATLCIAGDLDPAQAKAWIERYFGTLRRSPASAGQAAAVRAVAQSRALGRQRASDACASLVRLSQPARVHRRRPRAGRRDGHPRRRQGNAALSAAGRANETGRRRQRQLGIQSARQHRDR